MQKSESRIALLIDADNAPAEKIEFILSEISNYGVANIRRAYGNWTKPSLAPWQARLHEHAISPMQQFDYTKGKNATDAALIIDAMDLLYTKNLDAFAIVSSDCDFTPLVMRILTNGLKAYGFGEAKTPAPFVRACSTFSYLESIMPSAELKPKATAIARKSGQALKQNTKLMNLLRSAVSSTCEKKWSNLSAVSVYLKNQTAFDSHSYGYAKLSCLFEAIDLFEVRRQQKGVYVREKGKV